MKHSTFLVELIGSKIAATLVIRSAKKMKLAKAKLFTGVPSDLTTIPQTRQVWFNFIIKGSSCKR